MAGDSTFSWASFVKSELKVAAVATVLFGAGLLFTQADPTGFLWMVYYGVSQLLHLIWRAFLNKEASSESNIESNPMDKEKRAALFTVLGKMFVGSVFVLAGVMIPDFTKNPDDANSAASMVADMGTSSTASGGVDLMGTIASFLGSEIGMIVSGVIGLTMVSVLAYQVVTKLMNQHQHKDNSIEMSVLPVNNNDMTHKEKQQQSADQTPDNANLMPYRNRHQQQLTTVTTSSTPGNTKSLTPTQK